MASNKNNSLMHYAGMATQLLVGLGLTTFLGIWLDKKRTSSAPLFIWLLPIVLLLGILVKIIKDTSKK